MNCSLLDSSTHGIARQGYWSGVLFPSPGILPTQGWNLRLSCLLHWQADSLPLAPPGKPPIPSHGLTHSSACFPAFLDHIACGLFQKMTQWWKTWCSSLVILPTSHKENAPPHCTPKSTDLWPEYNGLINPPGARTGFSQCRFTWPLVFQLILSKAVGWGVGWDDKSKHIYTDVLFSPAHSQDCLHLVTESQWSQANSLRNLKPGYWAREKMGEKENGWRLRFKKKKLQGKRLLTANRWEQHVCVQPMWLFSD